MQVSLLDCDVEAPNAHLFLNPDLTEHKAVQILIPQVDESLCNACGRCAEVCQYHAIVVIGEKTLIFPELCHGCGSCSLLCPKDAIHEVPKSLGQLARGVTPAGIHFSHGILDVGEPMAVPVIHQLKKWREAAYDGITIVDAPPGTSCPVVESLRGSDFVLLVTEPTPFGLHDLRLAVQLTREINLPAVVIVNRAGIGDDAVDDYCRNVGLPILMRIPYSRAIGEGIARGKTLIDIDPEFAGKLRALYAKIALPSQVREVLV
jgi:MinD superfamily P-loop ATPase